MADVITLGESMVLFSPHDLGSLKYVHSFSKTIGGAESNVAIALSRLGHHVGWISKLGRDPFGEYVLSTIRGEGVDVSQVCYSDDSPTGVMFKEKPGFGETNVYYYRRGSAASQLRPTDLSKEYFSQAKYLHLTGITPALSEGSLETVRSAIKLAKKLGVRVSFDPNIRLKLWNREKARTTILELIQNIDICLPGYQEAYILTESRDPEEQAKILMDMGPQIVVIKLEEKGAFYKTVDQLGFIPAFQVNDIIDTVGAGDGFAAGLLSAFLDGENIEKAVQRGCAVGAYALRSRGDFEGYPTKYQLQAFIEGKQEIAR